MQRVGKLRVQVDRWPIDDLPNTPQVLTIICAGMYPGRPRVADILKALQDAAKILKTIADK